MAAQLGVDFLGHSSTLIDLDGARILTDPALRSRIGPLLRTVAPPPGGHVERPDIVLVSHLHWDHLDLPSLRAVGRDARILVPAGAGEWLRGRGFDRVTELPAGGSVDVGGLTIEAVPAEHSGFRPPFGPTADAIGYVVRGGRSLYFAGDTDLHPSMAELEGIDVALLPVWGWGPTLGRGRHLDPARAAEAARLIGAPTVVPIHWGTYWPAGLGRLRRELLIAPPRDLVRIAAEIAPEVRILPTDIGERVALP